MMKSPGRMGVRSPSTVVNSAVTLKHETHGKLRVSVRGSYPIGQHKLHGARQGFRGLRLARQRRVFEKQRAPSASSAVSRPPASIR